MTTTPSSENPYLNQPYETPVTSWLQSLASGVVFAFLLGRKNKGSSFLLGASAAHLLPRLRLWYATIQRRTQLTVMANKKRQARDTRRDAMRSSILMSDLQVEGSICRLMAHELLEKMRNKSLTCEEVVRAFCSRALRLGEITGAVTDELYEEAIQRAIEVDAIRNQPNHDVNTEPPLLGLPFSTKDQINIKGYDSTAGAQVRVFAPANEDAVVVALLREAGAIPFVKTNVPQSLMITESYNKIFGRARNPWNLDRTPGGSSGGEGAILGMDASPLGIGTDIGGSIRTPCGYCGIVGLKPSSGRISRVGLMAARFDQRNGQEGVKSVVGPMARSVDDLVLAMKVWLTPQQHLWDYDGVQAQPSFNVAAYTSTKPLRIGMVVSDDFYPTCSTSRRAVLEAADALRSQGHTVIELHTKNTQGTGVLGGLHSATDDYTVLPGFGDAFGLFVKILGADGKMYHQIKGLEGEDILDDYKLQHTLGLVPDAVREIIGPVVGLLAGERLQRMLVTMRSSMSTQEYWDTLADRTKYKKRFEKVYRHHQLDCLLTPGTGLPAHEHGKFGEVALAALYLSLFNFLDWTAGSVPVTTVNKQEEGFYKGTGFKDKYDRKGQEQMENSFGLPMGVQISAPSGREEVVLRAMKDLEQVVKFRKKHEPKGLGDVWVSRL